MSPHTNAKYERPAVAGQVCTGCSDCLGSAAAMFLPSAHFPQLQLKRFYWLLVIQNHLPGGWSNTVRHGQCLAWSVGLKRRGADSGVSR